MRWSSALTAILVGLLMAFPGCLTEPANGQLDSESNKADLQRILVRGYLDNEHVFHVRFGAVNGYNEIVPFDGFAWVTLEPREGDDWIPRIWSADVWEGGFTKHTELPYWEFTTDATFLDYGDPVRMVAKAELPDGTIIHGERESYA